MNDWNSIDWDALNWLRRAFLDGTAGRADYWSSEQDLASYDATFARRIAWKWDLVLAELRRLGWRPPPGPVLDWGCGTGVAGRGYLSAFGADAAPRAVFWDRSARARDYAARAARLQFPGLATDTTLAAEPPATLLISHVLTELDAAALDGLLQLVASATAVLWVEPGTHEVSRRLITVREQLRASFRLIAPCPHREACGMLAPGNEHHWCHHFADPPTGAFTDGRWAKFGQETGIDLRSLALSYLVLDRRDGAALPADTVRLMGRPRVYKAHALVFGCTAAGVAERQLLKRSHPDAFRLARKDRLDTLHRWRCEGGTVRLLEPMGAAEPM